MEKEKARIQKEIDRNAQDLARIEQKLGNPDFTGKAPVHVIDKERKRAGELAEVLVKLRESLANLG